MASELVEKMGAVHNPKIAEWLNGNRRSVQTIFFGSRAQNKAENVRPAKKVVAARAVWPVRKLRIAEAVQQHMITKIKTMITTRRRFGVNMP